MELFILYTILIVSASIVFIWFQFFDKEKAKKMKD